ncbi:MAG: DNA repair protein RecO [Saprospiraceae bacterium]
MSVLVHTEGIVLKTQKYGETSLISQVLTRDLGLQSLIMGGVTTGNSKKGMFQLMNQLDLVIYYQDQKSMHRIKEVKYATIYQSLPFEIHRSAVGIFMLELIRKSLRNSELDHQLYDWIKRCLDQCDEPALRLNYMPVYFLIGLTRFLGFCPLNNFEKGKSVFDLREGCFVDYAPFHRDYLDQDLAQNLALVIENENYLQLLHTVIPASIRKQLMYSLLDYYKIHLDHFTGLDSPHILEEILAA